MSITAKGIAEFNRQLSKVDRKLTKERQKIIRGAAAKTLVPAMKSRAKSAPGKAGPLLAKAVSARNGRNGAVVVGPRGGKRGVWWRHIVIGGAKPHLIGQPKSGTAPFLSNPAAMFAARGPVQHPGMRAHPFVEEATDAARPEFIEAVKRGLFTDRKES